MNICAIFKKSTPEAGGALLGGNYYIAITSARPGTLISFCVAIALAGSGAVEAKADSANGAAIFKKQCSVCHSVASPPVAGVGPSLLGVVGRKAASSNFAYSPALKALGITWSKATLDRFLRNPAAMAPGTAMLISIADDAARTDVIAYLSEQK